MIDHNKLQILIGRLYKTVAELEEMFPGRHFTPDGHLVGSIGECIVADAYDLALMPASNKGYDAVDANGRKIEIKATQANSVDFRSEPEFAIAIKISSDGTFEELFNGPGKVIWDQVKSRPVPSNGQYQIAINRLRELNAEVLNEDRIKTAQH